MYIIFSNCESENTLDGFVLHLYMYINVYMCGNTNISEHRCICVQLSMQMPKIDVRGFHQCVSSLYNETASHTLSTELSSQTSQSSLPILEVCFIVSRMQRFQEDNHAHLVLKWITFLLSCLCDKQFHTDMFNYNQFRRFFKSKYPILKFEVLIFSLLILSFQLSKCSGYSYTFERYLFEIQILSYFAKILVFRQ